jgi:hypothetical protein
MTPRRWPRTFGARYQAVATSFVLMCGVFFVFNAVWPHVPPVGVAVQVGASVLLGPVLWSLLGGLLDRWLKGFRR